MQNECKKCRCPLIDTDTVCPICGTPREVFVTSGVDASKNAAHSAASEKAAPETTAFPVISSKNREYTQRENQSGSRVFAGPAPTDSVSGAQDKSLPSGLSKQSPVGPPATAPAAALPQPAATFSHTGPIPVNRAEAAQRFAPTTAPAQSTAPFAPQRASQARPAAFVPQPASPLQQGAAATTSFARAIDAAASSLPAQPGTQQLPAVALGAAPNQPKSAQPAQQGSNAVTRAAPPSSAGGEPAPAVLPEQKQAEPAETNPQGTHAESEPEKTKKRGFKLFGRKAADSKDASSGIPKKDASAAHDNAKTPPAAKTDNASVTASPLPSPSPAKDPAAPSGTGALERQLIEKRGISAESESNENADGAENSAVKRRPADVFLTILFFVAVAALAVVTAVFFVTPKLESATDPSATSYNEYLAGRWISDEFTYTENGEPRAELLMVTSDGGFSLSCLIPNEDFPLGYTDGSWAEESSITGTISSYPSENRIVLLYNDGEKSFYYDRYFVTRSDDDMILREYYDESKTEFYDMHFRRFVE